MRIKMAEKCIKHGVRCREYLASRMQLIQLHYWIDNYCSINKMNFILIWSIEAKPEP